MSVSCQEFISELERSPDAVHTVSFTVTSGFRVRWRLRRYLKQQESNKNLELRWKARHRLFRSYFDVEVRGKGLRIRTLYKNILHME